METEPVDDVARIRAKIRGALRSIFEKPRMHAIHLETLEFKVLTLIGAHELPADRDVGAEWMAFVGRGYKLGNSWFWTYLEQSGRSEAEQWALMNFELREFAREIGALPESPPPDSEGAAR